MLAVGLVDRGDTAPLRRHPAVLQLPGPNWLVAISERNRVEH